MFLRKGDVFVFADFVFFLRVDIGVVKINGEVDARSNAGAALMSCISTLVLLFIVIGGVSLIWLKLLILPSLIAIAILALCAYWLLRKAEPVEEIEPEDSPMFSLKEAAIIAGTLTIIQAGVYGLELLLGDSGLIAGTLLASLFEIHAAAAAVVIQGEPTNTSLLYAMMLGLGAHAVSKSINAAISGGLKFALYFAPVQILHMAILIGVLWWMVQR